jgi:2-keto-4-pentenoate hydratase/2-oxohepta-3-ene-1,7-dioic acid hydratase in catechol pathway
MSGAPVGEVPAVVSYQHVKIIACMGVHGICQPSGSVPAAVLGGDSEGRAHCAAVNTIRCEQTVQRGSGDPSSIALNFANMKLVTFRHKHQPTAGLVLAEGILPLAEAAQAAGESVELSSVLDIIRGGEAALEACQRLAGRAGEGWVELVPLAQALLLAPIPAPTRNIFCVGRNYVDHVKEGAATLKVDLKLPEAPQFFTKATRTVIGPGADVRLDKKVTLRLDYEVELALVIGRGGRDIAPTAAFEHIFGYSIANDVTARDLQRRHEQWFKGKSLDTTLPFGPWIIDREELGDPTTLELSMTVNGEERQRARVAQMIFDIPYIIASLSAGLTLEPGDVIATGTPSGVGFAMNPPQFLRGGDEMVARIDRIGELRNRVVEV